MPLAGYVPPRWVMLVALVGGFVLGTAVAALAYPRQGTCAGGPSETRYRYYLDDINGEGWDSLTTDNFIVGAETWNVVQDPYNGGPFVDIQLGSLLDFNIQVVTEHIGAGYGGRHNCTGLNGSQFIAIDVFEEDEIPTPKQIQALAAHEMGHALDMKHSGDRDSFGTSIVVDDVLLPDEKPTMSTCVGLGGKHTLSQDDHGNMAYRFTGPVGPGPVRNIHANASFENGASFWGKDGGATITVVATGGEDGPAYAQIGGTYGGTIYQTMRWSDPHDAKGRFNYRKVGPSSGQLFMGIYGRAVDYDDPNSSCTDGKFVNNWNMNEPTISGNPNFVFRKGAWVTPAGVSWALKETSEWDIPGAWDAVDVRIRIFNYMTSAEDVVAGIDNARARKS